MRVRVTNHAVDRYIERVRPGLDFATARAEILRLTRTVGERSARPAWVETDTAQRTGVALGDDVWFPLETGDVVTTCLARGWISDRARAHRNASKAARRFNRSHKRDGHRSTDFERSPRPDRDGAWAA